MYNIVINNEILFGSASTTKYIPEIGDIVEITGI